MKTYRDPETGYEVRQYTFGLERNAKHYFTTENFTADDKYFFFTKEKVDPQRDQDVVEGLYRADVETGEITLMADAGYTAFCMHYEENYALLYRTADSMVCRMDVETGEKTELGRFPKGAVRTSHLTVSRDGRIACSLQLENKIYALAYLDPGQTEAQVAFMTDQCIGHCQICPSDSNQIFYVHETMGDALQRTWMYDVSYRMSRPYYVEQPNEWITHETWSADGTEMALMWMPGKIIIGDKDGRHFDVAFESERRILHPGISRDKQWLCTDMTWPREDGKWRWAVALVNPRTGKHTLLAHTRGNCLTGSDHLHPSFNRAGDKILFSAPDENGVAQVCVIDLNQVQRP